MSVTPLPEATDASEYGGKAASLGRAAAAGSPVPEGVAVSWSALEAIVAGNDAARGQLADVASELASGEPLAVRSSAIGEDSSAQSFAGIHESVLGVRGLDAIVDALETVWRSAHSDAARVYRAQLSLPATPRIAAVIQRCVDAECAGVMFTRCPVTGADERVIEGAWGLGEVVVAGLVAPDSFRVDRDGRVLERTPGDKPIARRLTETGTIEESLSPERAGELCLRDEDLLSLHRLAEHCDRVYGSRLHDIEWALSRGRLFLLQRRPITVGM